MSDKGTGQGATSPCLPSGNGKCKKQHGVVELRSLASVGASKSGGRNSHHHEGFRSTAWQMHCHWCHHCHRNTPADTPRNPNHRTMQPQRGKEEGHEEETQVLVKRGNGGSAYLNHK